MAYNEDNKPSDDQYWYDDTMPELAIVTIKFKDTEGENVGRTESFIFKRDDYESMSEEMQDKFFGKYESQVVFVGKKLPIHSARYIAEFYTDEEKFPESGTS
jgi:hypothetical protein